MSRPKTTYVSAGSYSVSGCRSEILESILATCVGVAIVDRSANVGGLYHILLPEQTWNDSSLDPRLCASSGLPLFLKELEAQGASVPNMEATIAGGALFGDISKTDLDLDLGGRTVEVANRILRQAGVRLLASETGGYFGYRLEVDLNTLKSNISPIFSPPQQCPAPLKRLNQINLDRTIAQVRPIPQVALKLIRSIGSDDYNLPNIAAAILQDQVISAKVLRACNSAYVSVSEEIQSIEKAILMLGGRLVGQIIMTSAVDTFFAQSGRSYSMSKGGLYHHAVSAAIVAEQIAKQSNYVAPDIAYTAGLLHDIGKVLLDQYASSAMPFFYKSMVEQEQKLLETEQALLGISHLEAGARLAELWKFPLALQDVIACHSNPSRSVHDKVLTHLVYLADLLVSRFDAGRELDCIGTEELSETMRILNLTKTTLPVLISRIPWNILVTPGYF